VLAALCAGEVLTTSGLARKAKLDRKVARMRAEALKAVGVVRSLRAGGDEDDEENDRRPVSWRLAGGEDGQVIAAVLRDHENWAAQGWDEKWSTHTPPPPRSREMIMEADGGNPLFVPPSAVSEDGIAT
jgi:hypothetical protein